MLEIFEHMFRGSKDDLFALLKECLSSSKKIVLVTANPEVVTCAQKDERLAKALVANNTIISPDGEGIVKAARMLGFPIWGKIAGVDTVQELLKYCGENSLRVYFYGSKQEVLDALSACLLSAYPDIVIVGAKNGYTNNAEEVFENIHETKPDLILVALGVPRQEQMIFDHLHMFDKGMFIGVGGSLDVLSGTKKRAPSFIIKLKMEWAYRLLKEPRRIKKFYASHVKFVMRVKKMSKHK